MKLKENLKKRIKRARKVEEIFAVMAFLSYFLIGLGFGLHDKVAGFVSIGVALISFAGLNWAEKRRNYYQKNLAHARERDEKRRANYYFYEEKEAA